MIQNREGEEDVEQIVQNSLFSLVVLLRYTLLLLLYIYIITDNFVLLGKEALFFVFCLFFSPNEQKNNKQC